MHSATHAAGNICHVAVKFWKDLIIQSHHFLHCLFCHRQSRLLQTWYWEEGWKRENEREMASIKGTLLGHCDSNWNIKKLLFLNTPNDAIIFFYSDLYNGLISSSCKKDKKLSRSCINQLTFTVQTPQKRLQLFQLLIRLHFCSGLNFCSTSVFLPQLLWRNNISKLCDFLKRNIFFHVVSVCLMYLPAV